MKINIATFLIFYTAILCLSVNAQNSSDSIQNFSSKDISFSYPSNWKVVEKSLSGIQHFNLVPESGNVLIMVIAVEPKISTASEFQQLKRQITKPRLDGISQKFSKADRSGVCIEIKDSKVPGQRISGLYGEEETTSDNFSFVMDDKFFNLVYLKENKESSKADVAWETLVKTLKVKGKDSKKNEIISDSENGRILNGEAIKLPKPIFPSGVKFHNDQIIEVIVTVDENGDVISAKANDGEFALQLAAIQAAKEAKFKPTLVCGEPAKMSGILVYKFVRR